MASADPPLSAPVIPPDSGEESIIIDCTKSNFVEQSNDFIQRVGKASFIAIDEEMTGIQLPPSLGQSDLLIKDASPSDRYPGTKQVSERYSIIQLGICLFQEDTENPEKIHVRRYKFTMFPPEDSKITREVVLSPSSVKFLVGGNNCNLNEWIKEGIPFCTGEMAEHLLTKYREDEEEKEAKESQPPAVLGLDGGSSRVQLRRLEDQQFHSRAMSMLREWLNAPSEQSPEDPEGMSLLLPPCNSFLRRALYESISYEYGTSLVLETVRESNQIKVWRLTTAERKQRQMRLRREGFERILMEKVGTLRVFLALHLACSGRSVETPAEHMMLAANAEEALAEWEPSQTLSTGRKIPLIVHNGLQDLLFLMTHFHKDVLPESWPECKGMIHSYFPVIYDTKLMADEYCHRDNVKGRTYLGALYELSLLTYPRWNRVFTTDGTAEQQGQLHDAGFDAYCTGVAFYGVAGLIHQHCQFPTIPASAKFALWNYDPFDETIAWYYGRNKLYFHLSPYTIDLEASTYDPLARGMSRSSMFRVDGIDSSVTTRDIAQSLSALKDAMGQSVSYEIVWINNVRFLVGAMNLSLESRSHQEHGKLIFQAMKSRFPHARVDPFTKIDEEDVPEPGIWNLWGLLAGGKKRSIPRDDFAPKTKRQRLG